MATAERGTGSHVHDRGPSYRVFLPPSAPLQRRENPFPSDGKAAPLPYRVFRAVTEFSLPSFAARRVALVGAHTSAWRAHVCAARASFAYGGRSCCFSFQICGHVQTRLGADLHTGPARGGGAWFQAVGGACGRCEAAAAAGAVVCATRCCTDVISLSSSVARLRNWAALSTRERERERFGVSWCR